jgi:hypothetical protein
MPTNKNKTKRTTKKKVQYFRIDKFIDDVIRDMKLGDVTAPVLLDLQNEIAERVGDTILSTVIRSFKERELKMFENMLKDHPELDELDVLWLVAHEVEGLKEKLIREINSLYAQLVYDAEKIGEATKPDKNVILNKK